MKERHMGSRSSGNSEVRESELHVGSASDPGLPALDGGFVVADEWDRARLISDITRMIREPSMPDGTRTAGLTLIGWLARRMPGEQPHALGVPEARESERRVKAARKAAR